VWQKQQKQLFMFNGLQPHYLVTSALSLNMLLAPSAGPVASMLTAAVRTTHYPQAAWVW
jgi:hypothetical protein